MGPQPFGCGRVRSRRPNAVLLTLQWGRNLSVAEGCVGMDGGETASSLQWGRNLSVAEGPRLPPGVGVERGASMGPQPFGCGRPSRAGRRRNSLPRFNGAATFRLRKGHDAYVAARVGAASMGPQPFGCGRRHRARLARRVGRRFNGAATFRLRKGHLRRGARRGARRGFNGAATFRLRKGRRPPAWARRAPLLQWGRNLSVAEGQCFL